MIGEIRQALLARGLSLAVFDRLAPWRGDPPRPGEPATTLWVACCHGYLPFRAHTVLERHGILTVGQLARLTRGELAAIPGIGPKTIAGTMIGMRRLGFPLRRR